MVVAQPEQEAGENVQNKIILKNASISAKLSVSLCFVFVCVIVETFVDFLQCLYFSMHTKEKASKMIWSPKYCFALVSSSLKILSTRSMIEYTL